MQRVLSNASKNKGGFVLPELLRTTLSSGFIVVLWLQAMALLLHLQNRQRQRQQQFTRFRVPGPLALLPVRPVSVRPDNYM
jgi:hypothetical protein